MIRLKRRKAKKSGANPPSQIKCPSHLKWVRGHECAIADKHDCQNKIEAAHVRRGSDGYMGGKPSDTYAIPLCSEAHREQHAIGEKSFEKKYEIKMLEISQMLAHTSPHKIKWHVK